MALYDTNGAEYRYFVTDLLSNRVLAEIPFKGVSFERSIKAAGPFSGTIPVIPETASMDIYNSTMPGKTGLYVVRDQQCVWGGIIWSRSYNVIERMLNVNASEFTSYFYHRNIWKTWSHDFGANISVEGGVLTGTLINRTYDFPVDSAIRIIFPTTNMYDYNGYYTVTSSSNSDTFTATNNSGLTVPDGVYIDATVYSRVDTYDFFRQLIDEVLTDFAGTSFPNSDIEPGVATTTPATNLVISGSSATITTSTPHGAIPTQMVELYNMGAALAGSWLVTSVPSDTSIVLDITGVTGATSTALSTVTKNVTFKSVADFTGTITTDTAHGFAVGDTVIISGVDGCTVAISNKQLKNGIATITTAAAHSANIGESLTVKGVDATFNGVYYVDTVPNSTTITYLKEGAADVASTAVTGGTAQIEGFTDVFNGTRTIFEVPTATTFTIDLADSDMATVAATGTVSRIPTVVVGTYGSFPGNADILIDYSTEEYSGSNVLNTPYRGYEMKSVGEELDEYSDTVNGFEYRVDCNLVYIDNIPTFTRTFVLIPIDFPDPPAEGEVSPPSRYGADKLVFEYPGSIIDVTMEETAEDAATRFFVIGNIPDLGEDASQPYAVASAVDLLQDGWPLLDQEETRSEVSDESQLYDHAERYLAESRPPISDIQVKVNGSLSPKIGEFVPGDWCSIIIEDEFVRMRLASDLEPRDTVIVRKIDGFKVNVPDSPSFPEETELTLVTEPQVDKRG